MDDDIQIIEPSTNSSPSTYGNLPTPPASEHPQPPSGPATQHRMIPTALQVRLLPPSYNFEHYVMEATRKSFHLQQMLVQGAETVDTINEMLLLKDETVQYVYLMYKSEQGVPNSLPYFYGFSLFWITMKSQRHGRRTVYAHHLADVIKQRISQELGRQMTETGPTWTQIQQTLLRYGHRSHHKNPKLREEAAGFLERLIGETYQYIDYHYKNYGNFPKTTNFFFNFCLFYNSLGLEGWGRDYFRQAVVSRLRRSLSQLPAHFFDQMQAQLDFLLR